jgi:SNF2 family DNA or RNA helicase
VSSTIDLCQNLWKTKPYAHQIEGVKLLLDHQFFGIFSEMGTGKTKQVVDAACVLCEAEQVDSVLVVSPASVRGVWLDAEMGEIRKHAWVPSRALEYHGKKIKVVWTDEAPELAWIVTNYEFIRVEKNRERLQDMMRDRRVLLVLDESSFVKNRRAAQTRACMELGKLAVRRVILSGTPITNNPLDLWSQISFLSPKILPYRNFYHFRANFAVMGGWQHKQVARWVNLEQLQQLVAPHVIRREKKDCLDLPEKIYTQLEVPLTDTVWKTYRQMRDEAVVWLGENPSEAAQAGVRVMRLAQITSGFLGGFPREDALAPRVRPQEVGREKLECLTAWVKERLLEKPSLKIIVWCRFVAEIERAARELARVIPTYKLYGNQSVDERKEAIALFSRPDEDPNSSPAMLVAQPQAGGFGLNLVAADTVVYLSNDFNLATRLQSEDRVHRPGQTRHVLYVDIIATGPAGQRTVDHEVVKALRNKADLARWTASAWRAAIMED